MAVYFFRKTRILIMEYLTDGLLFYVVKVCGVQNCFFLLFYYT